MDRTRWLYFGSRRPPRHWGRSVAGAATALILMGYLQTTTLGKLNLTFAYIGTCMAIAWNSSTRIAVVSSLVCSVMWILISYFNKPEEMDRWWWLNWALRSAAITGFSIWAGWTRLRFVQEGRASRHDAITGLLNRRGFIESVDGILLRGGRSFEPFTIMYVDCDRFKELNDERGHHFGDDVLTSIGLAITQSIRGCDSAARLGGDEFGILLYPCDSSDAPTAAERLRSNLMNRVMGVEPPITFSMGVVTFTANPATVADCLDSADAAMYRIKHGGRDGIRFEVVPEANGEATLPFPAHARSRASG